MALVLLNKSYGRGHRRLQMGTAWRQIEYLLAGIRIVASTRRLRVGNWNPVFQENRTKVRGRHLG